MTGLVQDIRYAFRGLVKNPGLAIAAISTLGLGVGATTAVYTLVHAVLLSALPVKAADELVIIGPSRLQLPAFLAFREHSDLFSGVLASSGVQRLDAQSNIAHGRPIDVSFVSGSFFSTLGVHPVLGRGLTEDDDRLGSPRPVAVSSHAWWLRQFGGDRNVVGTAVRVGGARVTIVGVAEPGFFGEEVGAAPDLWMPLGMWADVVPGRNLLRSPGTAWLRLIGRLRPEVTEARAEAVLSETFRRVLSEIFGPAPPGERRARSGLLVGLQPAAQGLPGFRDRFKLPLQLLMGAVVLVLLIACANVANLLLARATARRREFDIRLALGMSARRLIRQLLTESLLLAGIAGAIALAVGWAGTAVLLRMFAAGDIRLPVTAGLPRMVIFSVLVSLSTAVLFGLAPLWQLRGQSFAASVRVRRASGDRVTHRTGTLLIVSQIAVSLVLLTGAGLFMKTLANLRKADLGFRHDHLLVVEVNPARGLDGARAIQVQKETLVRLRSLPGVTGASLAEHGVLAGRDNGTDLMRPEGFVAGPQGTPRSQWDVVGPAYFTTLGIPIARGRDFRQADDVSAPLVVAINEHMARTLFGTTVPIGRRLLWGDGGAPLTIVAVVRDARQSGPRDEALARFYLPYLQMPAIRPNWILEHTRFLVRTHPAPADLVSLVRQTLPLELLVRSVRTGDALFTRALHQERMIASLLTAFAVIAVLLASMGLSGLTAYLVVQRTAEIGVRMALGADRGTVLRMVLERSLLWSALGLAIGMPIAIAAARFSRSLLYGLSPTDAATLAGAAFAMMSMSLFAGYIPARCAARIDPLVALRYE